MAAMLVLVAMEILVIIMVEVVQAVPTIMMEAVEHQVQ